MIVKKFSQTFVHNWCSHPTYVHLITNKLKNHQPDDYGIYLLYVYYEASLIIKPERNQKVNSLALLASH